MLEIIVLGLSHKTAPVEIRERLAAPDGQLQEILQTLTGRPYIQEALYLSTCNRVEIYATAKSAHAGAAELRRFFTERAGCRESDLVKVLYEYQGQQAARHAFRVASSLDSMVLGEPQILGQVKGAFQSATEARTVGPILSRLFQKSFQVAKRVRTETGIAKNAVSLSYAAVELARKVLDDLSGKDILLLGAGKMGELSAKHLRQAGCGEIMVANRSPERAIELARRIGGRPRSLADLDLLLERADVVISSTAAPGYIVTARDMEPVVRRRRGRPLIMIDLAVPRDIDPQIASFDGVYTFDVDNLERVIEANLKERRREASVAEKLIEAEAAQFAAWLKGLDVVPTIVSLREKIQGIAAAECSRTLSTLSHLADRDRKAIEGLLRAVVNKILHEPTSRLRQSGSDEESGARLAEAARLLFNLPEPSLQESEAAPVAAPLEPKKR